MTDSDMQRANGESEAVRRRDGGGETSPLPGSESARGNAEAENTATGVARPAELWRPGGDAEATRPGDSPADAAMAGTAPADGPAQPDDDSAGGGGRIPMPASARPESTTGADAPSHGSR